MEKPDPYHPSLPHVVSTNGFQVLLSSITCLPSYLREGICFTLPSIQYMCFIQSANDPQDPYPTLCTLGIKTPVQCQFSLELACCSNSISHSDKLYFPLILSHVWKFFSNPYPDHNSQYNKRLLLPHKHSIIPKKKKRKKFLIKDGLRASLVAQW